MLKGFKVHLGLLEKVTKNLQSKNVKNLVEIEDMIVSGLQTNSLNVEQFD